MVMTIETEDGKVNVWESAGLSSLFDIEDGIYVRITNHGMKLNPKTGRKFRNFTVEYSEGEEEPKGPVPEEATNLEPF